MNLPLVNMNYNGVYEQRHCDSALSGSPRFETGFGAMEKELDFEDAVFLIGKGAIDKYDYITEVTQSEWALEYAPDVETNELLFEVIEEQIQKEL